VVEVDASGAGWSRADLAVGYTTARVYRTRWERSNPSGAGAISG
jgi:hypothetical protein